MSAVERNAAIREAVRDIVDCVEWSGDRQNIILDEDVAEIIESLLTQYHYVRPSSILIEFREHECNLIESDDIFAEDGNPYDHVCFGIAVHDLLCTEGTGFTEHVISEHEKIVDILYPDKTPLEDEDGDSQ